MLHLAEKCEYLNYSVETTSGRRDVNGGSLEMFQKCGIEKVRWALSELIHVGDERDCLACMCTMFTGSVYVGERHIMVVIFCC